MPVLEGVKFACEQCIIGHRTGKCNHNDGRELFPIRARGRPRSQCDACQEKRRTASWHSKCDCKPEPTPTPTPPVPAAPAPAPAPALAPIPKIEAGPAVVAARQRGYKISTGPQPRRMRKDRLRDEQRGFKYLGAASSSSSPSSRAVAAPATASSSPSPSPSPSSSPLSSSTLRLVEVAQQAAEAALAIQSFAGPSNVGASTSFLAPEPALFLSPPPSFDSRLSNSDWHYASLPPPPPPPPPGTTLSQTFAPSSTIEPPPSFLDSEPRIDALLQAINVVRQGPASIKCSCKGSCRCLSCAGRPQYNQVDRDTQGSCCGSSKRKPQRSAKRRTEDEEGQRAPKRTKRAVDVDRADLQLSPHPQLSSSSISSTTANDADEDDGDEEEDEEEPADDCASCGACDLELKLPSGIPDVDRFAAAGTPTATYAGSRPGPGMTV
ncbi:hypothetical protein A4X03_0g3072 [Tilletia caries]|uniref:Uncharacterized protein n=1 Tax=Tilletia caries TaxID=13290 RepID=A0A177UUS3_9BASI|nr:hypothetical protein A4X03_0g3072 [Tilletia caries]